MPSFGDCRQIMQGPSRRALLFGSVVILLSLFVWRLALTPAAPEEGVLVGRDDNWSGWKGVVKYLQFPSASKKAEPTKTEQKLVLATAKPASAPSKPIAPAESKAKAPAAPAAAPTKVENPTGFDVVNLNGTIWRRVGQPFHRLELKNLVFAFKAPATTKNVLLAYGQTLEGVFHPKNRQFFAITLNDKAATFWLMRRGDKAVQKFEAAGGLNNDQWHAISVSFFSPSISVSKDIKKPPVNPKADNSRPGFSFDSGLYIGAVVDRMSVTAYQEIHETFELFKGQLHSTVFVNGAAVNIDTSPEMNWGITDDEIGKYMSDVLKYNLAQPLTKIEAVDLKPTDPTMLNFPVVGAISDNHVNEMLDMPSSIVKNMPERGILIYDLGLNARSQQTLTALCNVTVRGFRRDVHPDFLKGLHGMRWKPLILHSVMQEFGGVLYADASIRFKKKINTIRYFSKGTGFIGFSPANVSPVSAFTHESTMNSLGMPRKDTAHQWLTIGGIQVWIDRRVVRETLMRQWLGCALSPKCMNPPGATPYGCNFGARYQGGFIGCHRYDQSAISVILQKMFHDDKGLDYLVNDPEDLEYASIERGPTTHYPRCQRP